jgi:hypothetical protein
MMTLMRNGGFPMWFIVAFGLVALGGAFRYAFQPDAARLGFVKYMASATLFATLAGLFMDVAAVCRALAGQGPIPPEALAKEGQMATFLFGGITEAMSPGILGFLLLTLVALVCGVGRCRQVAQA